MFKFLTRSTWTVADQVALGIVVVVSLLTAAGWVWRGWLADYFGPHPYANVEIAQFYEEKGVLVGEITFIKRECTLHRIDMVVGRGPFTELLNWTDLDGLDRSHARSVGPQTFRFEAALDGFEGAEWFEVRAVHYCEGYSDPRSSVFLRVEAPFPPPPVVEPTPVEITPVDPGSRVIEDG